MRLNRWSNGFVTRRSQFDSEHRPQFKAGMLDILAGGASRFLGGRRYLSCCRPDTPSLRPRPTVIYGIATIVLPSWSHSTPSWK